MSSTVTFHPTAKIAFTAIVIALVVGFSLVSLKRFLESREVGRELVESQAPMMSQVETHSEFLLPVIRLAVDPDSHESDWSEALAAVLSGRTEVSTEHGRVDVLTEHFAIEVDRLAKWHESIGQASHYAATTKKRPVVALILLPEDRTDKLELIEDTCTSKGIKLVLLQTTKKHNKSEMATPRKPSD